jgi:hypothetical protein
VWELATGQELTPITIPYTPVLAFSGDGGLLASAAHDFDDTRKGETRIHLWDGATGRELAEFRGHDAFVNSLAFSPDGQRLATGLTDSTVLLWDLRPVLRRAAAARRVPRPEELARHWAALAAEDPRVAYAAVGALAAAPAESLPFLRRQMRPVDGVKPERLRQLLADLDSEQFAVRRTALEELEKLDTLVESALEEVLRQKPLLERRRRAEQLLERMRGIVRTPEARRIVRAVAVLERVGTPEARQFLKALSAGAAEARLTREAARALERLERRTGAEKAIEGREPAGPAPDR